MDRKKKDGKPVGARGAAQELGVVELFAALLADDLSWARAAASAIELEGPSIFDVDAPAPGPWSGGPRRVGVVAFALLIRAWSCLPWLFRKALAREPERAGELLAFFAMAMERFEEGSRDLARCEQVVEQCLLGVPGEIGGPPSVSILVDREHFPRFARALGLAAGREEAGRQAEELRATVAEAAPRGAPIGLRNRL